jgi:hypothetical protein
VKLKNKLSFNNSKEGNAERLTLFLNLFIMKEKNNISKKKKELKKEQTILDRFLQLNPNIEILIKKFNLKLKSSDL